MSHAIPTYELYGEMLSGAYSDPVHHETINERSSKRNWTIRLHRHSRLAQIFLFRTPVVFLHLNEVEHTSTESLSLIVPPGAEHDFRFNEDVVGDVLSLPINQLDTQTLERLQQIAQGWGVVLTRSAATHFDSVEGLMQQVAVIFHNAGTERTALPKTIAKLMVIYLVADANRQLNIGTRNETVHLTRHEMQAQEFCNLVEGRFSSDDVISGYASKIGVSPPHLTRICKQVLGSPPNEVVRQRRIVEAKRLLEFTRLPVSDIAYRSGFRNAAFFSRTFKSTVGQTPQDYRKNRD